MMTMRHHSLVFILIIIICIDYACCINQVQNGPEQNNPLYKDVTSTTAENSQVVPAWIWWLMAGVGGVAFFYFLLHLIMGRRLHALTGELRIKNRELQKHKEHLEELVQKRTKSLKESESKYRLLAENASDVIWTIDRNGIYLYVSPSVERVRGYKPDEIIGSSLESTLAKESAVYVRNIIRQLLLADKQDEFVLENQRIEIQQPCKDGSIIWAEVMASPIYDNKGEIIGFQGVTRDITDRKETELALKRTNDRLKAANEELKQTQSQLIQSEKMASLGQLTSGIAHEINNPVNYVYTSVSPLCRDIEDVKKLVDACLKITETGNKDSSKHEIADLAKSLDIEYLFDEVFSLVKGIREGAERTKEIVEGLRNFSRLDTDKLTPANIHEGLDSTLMLLHNQFKDRIEIEKEYGMIPPVDCFPGKLNQVFMNILSNAFQAIEGKGVVKIKTRKKENAVYITIQDSGRGMPSDVLSRIFDPFYTTKGIGKGTGLGLSVSYGIIEQHKGRIEVESQAGQGSEFTVILPLNLAELILE